MTFFKGGLRLGDLLKSQRVYQFSIVSLSE